MIKKRKETDPPGRRAWTNGLAFEPKEKKAIPDTSAIPWLRVTRKVRSSSPRISETGRCGRHASRNR